MQHPTDRKIRVLIVDDADVILTALTNFLKEYNFEVSSCRDGLDGILKATEMKPDLIFLDLVMPTMDGTTFLNIKKDIKEIARIPVIVITGKNDKPQIMEALNAGAAKVLSKPLKKDPILKFVTEVIGEDHFIAEQSGDHGDSKAEQLKQELKKAFLVSFNNKKHQMLEALEKHDQNALLRVIHEIKGAGGTVGLHNIKELTSEVETKVVKDHLDWLYLENQCKKIISEITKFTKEMG